MRLVVMGASMVLLATLPPRGVGAQTDAPELSWYGYVKLDASWDESLVNAGNFARWAESTESFEERAHFNLTGRQTRLGFRATEDRGGVALTGKVEVDFCGGGAENKNSLQMRHAYVEAVWPSGWRVLAGQTSDVISPLNPATLNYTVAWWAGNTGYRRPQLRVTKVWRVDEQTAAAVSSSGGWAQLRWSGGGADAVSVGAGLDDPDDDDLVRGFRARVQVSVVYAF